MPAHGKGSSFERKICKALGLWWTKEARDDIYWRTSQSGGRATTRGKNGKATHGQYGDITAVDPIGSPLTELFCLELKAGYSKKRKGKNVKVPWCLLDLLDMPPAKTHPLTLFVAQAQEAAKAAGTKSYALILHRDCHSDLIVMPIRVWNALLLMPGGEPVKGRYMIKHYPHVILNLDIFFKAISPRMIIELNKKGF